MSHLVDAVHHWHTRTLLRATLLVVILASFAVVGYGYVTQDEGEIDYSSSGQVVPPRENATVVTTSRLTDNFLVAFAPDGTVLYHNDSHDVYNDVDPVPGTSATVEYVATDHMNVLTCRSKAGCERNIVERVNLTTGETTRIYSRITPRNRDHWHDVDRLDDHRLLVGDIALDRVFVLNITTGVVEWGWDAQHEFPIHGGGMYPGDWTHLNDVERLPDGRVMVSLRNQDQVVFLHPDAGLQENWTLGADGAHSILYEQHNPDYIPAARGGVAIILADSENGRVLEYQHRGDHWERTWVWSDTTLQWPRDADRLPNGHTLVVDSNGDRLIEIDRSGRIVWEVPVAGSYDAERLETGDESAGGRSATAIGLRPRDTRGGAGWSPDHLDRVSLILKNSLPGPVVNSALYIAPGWMDVQEAVALLVGAAVKLLWGLAELWWSSWTLRSPITRGT